MATVADVYRFEQGVGDSKRLILAEDDSSLKTINEHIEKIESAMMEEFGCDRGGLKTLAKNSVLGPKAETALCEATKASFTDPMSAMKATAVRWEDKIEEWKGEARRRNAIYVVIGNDSFDYEDFPIYAASTDEAISIEQRLQKVCGVYHVVTVLA